MPDYEIDKKVQSIESIQYKILEELSKGKEMNGKLYEQLEYVNNQLLTSLNNEKNLLLLKQKQEEKLEELNKQIQSQATTMKSQIDTIQSQKTKIEELEKKYGTLKNSKAVQFTYKYWDLRKKIGLRGK